MKTLDPISTVLRTRSWTGYAILCITVWISVYISKLCFLFCFTILVFNKLIIKVLVGEEERDRRLSFINGLARRYNDFLYLSMFHVYFHWQSLFLWPNLFCKLYFTECWVWLFILMRIFLEHSTGNQQVSLQNQCGREQVLKATIYSRTSSPADYQHNIITAQNSSPIMERFRNYYTILRRNISGLIYQLW